MAEILPIAAGGLAAFAILRTGVLQVREFRRETGEDAWLTRVLALDFHKPEARIDS